MSHRNALHNYTPVLADTTTAGTYIRTLSENNSSAIHPLQDQSQHHAGISFCPMLLLLLLLLLLQTTLLIYD